MHQWYVCMCDNVKSIDDEENSKEQEDRVNACTARIAHTHRCVTACRDTTEITRIMG